MRPVCLGMLLFISRTETGLIRSLTAKVRAELLCVIQLYITIDTATVGANLVFTVAHIVNKDMFI